MCLTGCGIRLSPFYSLLLRLLVRNPFARYTYFHLKQRWFACRFAAVVSLPIYLCNINRLRRCLFFATGVCHLVLSNAVLKASVLFPVLSKDHGSPTNRRDAVLLKSGYKCRFFHGFLEHFRMFSTDNRQFQNNNSFV